MTTPQALPNDELNLTTSDARIQELLGRMQAIADLSAIGALVAWDQNTALSRVRLNPGPRPPPPAAATLGDSRGCSSVG